MAALLLGLTLAVTPTAIAAQLAAPTPTPTGSVPTRPAAPGGHKLADTLSIPPAVAAGSARANLAKGPAPEGTNSCYTIISKLKPGQTTSEVLAQGCQPSGATTAPARVPDPSDPTAPTSATPQAAPQATPQATPQTGGASTPLITFYACSNYCATSYTIYGNSGPCDASGYGISDNTTANTAVNGIRSFQTFNNCTNQKIYNQTQYGGTPAEFFGTATPYVGDAYSDHVLSVHLRARCSTYSPSNYNVCDQVRDDYEADGGPSGFLGAPTSNQITNTDNVGAHQNFANTGAIYTSPATGAHAVQGALLTEFQQLGSESGTLGYPASDNTQAQDNTGVFAQFFKNSTYAAGTTGNTNGLIMWGPNTGAHYMNGAILTKYAQMNDVKSCHGYPTSDVKNTAWGPNSEFPDGVWQFGGISRLIDVGGGAAVSAGCEVGFVPDTFLRNNSDVANRMNLPPDGRQAAGLPPSSSPQAVSNFARAVGPQPMTAGPNNNQETDIYVQGNGYRVDGFQNVTHENTAQAASQDAYFDNPFGPASANAAPAAGRDVHPNIGISPGGGDFYDYTGPVGSYPAGTNNMCTAWSQTPGHPCISIQGSTNESVTQPAPPDANGNPAGTGTGACLHGAPATQVVGRYGDVANGKPVVTLYCGFATEGTSSYGVEHIDLDHPVTVDTAYNFQACVYNLFRKGTRSGVTNAQGNYDYTLPLPNGRLLQGGADPSNRVITIYIQGVQGDPGNQWDQCAQ